MKAKALVIPFLGLVVAPSVSAQTSIDISDNEEGSTNSVVIRSVQNSEGATTDVRIESDGEVKTFQYEGNRDFDWSSEDGNTQVHIRGNNGGATVRQESKGQVETDVKTRVEGNRSEDQSGEDVSPSSTPTPGTSESETEEVTKRESDFLTRLRQSLEELRATIREQVRELLEQRNLAQRQNP